MKAENALARWFGMAATSLMLVACGSSPEPSPTAAPTAVSTPRPSPSPATSPAVIIPSLPSPSPSPSPEAGQTYTVQEGDTLAIIAERVYGDGTLWRRIYDANRQAIGENPDNVRIGTVLRIPPRP